MLVQVHTDNHIHGSAELSARVEDDVRATLERFADQITRVEVHLNDVNGPKGGSDDLRCQIEARLAGRQPVSVTEKADTLDAALAGALETLERMLDRTLDKLGHKKGQTSYGGDQTI